MKNACAALTYKVLALALVAYGWALPLASASGPLASSSKGKSTAPRASAASPKNQVLDQLRGWRERIIEADRKAQNEQTRHINALAKLSLKRDFANAESLEIATRDLDTPLEEISKIDLERWEMKSQRQIVDQLIFAVDTKWSGTDIKGFLEMTLMELSTTDLNEPGQGAWWRFLIQASISLREIAEPGADPIRYLEGYMSESSVLEPRSALDLMKNKNYVGN